MATLQTIVASFPDAGAARRGLVTLRNAGVADDAISVIGDVVVRPADDSIHLVREDRSMIMRIFWAGLIWGTVGAFVGAGIGYVLALLEFPTDNVAIQVASWAMFVHIAATLWAAYAVIYDGTPRTPPPRRPSAVEQAMVVVRSADPLLLERAERALHDAGAIGVRRTP